MNQKFTDVKKKVFIKVLDKIDKVEREINGAKYFSKSITTPLITKLDSKTLLIKKVDGVKSTKHEENALTNLVLTEIKNRKPIMITRNNFSTSIFEDIKIIKTRFKHKTNIYKFLCQLEIDLLEYNLFPIHGDLQKQNIFINKKNKLVYIDFEHFTIAPLELEIVNNLFFSDNNCLDVENIIKKLLKIDKIKEEMLAKMLLYYALKQFANKRSLSDTKKRLNSASKRIEDITEKDTTFTTVYL